MRKNTRAGGEVVRTMDGEVLVRPLELGSRRNEQGRKEVIIRMAGVGSRDHGRSVAIEM